MMQVVRPSLRLSAVVAALTLAAACLAACASPQQIQQRNWKKVDQERDASLLYLGSFNYKPMQGVCVDFYSNFATDLKKFQLRSMEERAEQCSRESIGWVCLAPSETATALVRYEFLIDRSIEESAARKLCEADASRTLKRLWPAPEEG